MSDHPVLALIRGKLSDPSRPFTIIADLEAHRSRGDEVATAIASSHAIRLTRAEPGCLAYDLLRDADSPDRFVAHERWLNLAALEAHLATPHFAAVGAALTGLLATTPTIRILTSVEGDETHARRTSRC
jgi:quinol monooxygenase YgiN